MTTEAAVYVGLILVGHVGRVVYSGIKNGAFYARGGRGQLAHKRLRPYVLNIHKAETPASLTTTLITFTGALAIARFAGLPFVYAFGVAGLWTLGAWQVAIPFHQGYINLGANLPFVDRHESGKAEIGSTGIMRPKLIYGRTRFIQPFIGTALILAGYLVAFLA